MLWNRARCVYADRCGSGWASTKSAVSHQLKALRLAGLVKFRREAQIVYYSLADDHVKEIIDKGFEHLRG